MLNVGIKPKCLKFRAFNEIEISVFGKCTNGRLGIRDRWGRIAAHRFRGSVNGLSEKRSPKNHRCIIFDYDLFEFM